MTWLTEILKIYLELQLLIKYYAIKTFNIAKNPKYDGFQGELVSMLYNFFDKQSSAAGKSTIKSEIISIQHPSDFAWVANKPMIRTFEKQGHYIWSANLTDMLLITKYKEFQFFAMCHRYF